MLKDILILIASATIGQSSKVLYLRQLNDMEFLLLIVIPTTHKLKDLLKKLTGSLKQDY
jgi:hypothetical protein